MTIPGLEPSPDPIDRDPGPRRRRPLVSPSARKLLTIGALFALTLIAGSMISGVIEEREQRHASVLEEFTASWGPEQFVRSPVLVVPYQNAPDQPRHYLKFAPAELKAAVQLIPEERKRGLFHATVYNAAVDLQGTFTVPPQSRLQDLIEPTGEVFWSESFIMIETAGLAGMTSKDRLIWNGEALAWQNCREIVTRSDDCQRTETVVARPHQPAVIAKTAATSLLEWFDPARLPWFGEMLAAWLHPVIPSLPRADSQLPFRASLTVRGTGGFRLQGQSREFDATIVAPWSTPSFSGTLLPSTSTVTETGFEAHWRTAQYAAPQIWSAARVVDPAGGGSVSAGVDLLEATPTYRMIHRASKYSILFVALSFTTYFLFELLSGCRINAIQYGLLGLSLSLFPLLLLSFSEPLGYAEGYAISAGLVMAQASLYTAAVAARVRPTALFTLMLAGLFGFLYVLLSLETYSLLVGSLALFAVLSIVMVLTQRIDWSRTLAPADAT